jgi:hypothetical protein
MPQSKRERERERGAAEGIESTSSLADYHYPPELGEHESAERKRERQCSDREGGSCAAAVARSAPVW